MKHENLGLNPKGNNGWNQINNGMNERLDLGDDTITYSLILGILSNFLSIVIRGFVIIIYLEANLYRVVKA